MHSCYSAMKCSTRVGNLEFVRKKLGKKVVYETMDVMF